MSRIPNRSRRSRLSEEKEARTRADNYNRSADATNLEQELFTINPRRQDLSKIERSLMHLAFEQIDAVHTRV